MTDHVKQIPSPSYMEFRLDMDEKCCPIFLRVPTFWDATKNKWMAVIKLDSGKLLHAEGSDSFELQNNFNVTIHDAFPEHGKELLKMFKPLEYWERK